MIAISLKQDIRKWFKEAVQLADCDPELKRMLLREYPPHPRLETFLDNLGQQFVEADKILVKKGLFVKRETMQTTVYDMTKVFITGFELEAKKRFESDLAKSAREAEAAKVAAMDDFLNGGTDNEYAEELGLINEEVKVKDAAEVKG